MKELILAFALAVAVLAVCTIPVWAEEPVFEPAQINVPAEAVYGHRPITITVSVKNPTNEGVRFTSKIWHGGAAWGGEDYPPASTGPYTLITGLECDQAGCTHYWGGWIDPQSTAFFTLPTFTGNVLGKSAFVSATYDILGNGVTMSAPVVTRTINITKGVGSVTGRLELEGEEGVWERNQVRRLSLTMESPTITHFWLWGGPPFTSTCGIQGLPGGFIGHYDITYEQFSWFVSLPEHSPGGKCIVYGSFWTGWPALTAVVPVSYEVQIAPHRAYFPLIFNK